MLLKYSVKMITRRTNEKKKNKAIERHNNRKKNIMCIITRFLKEVKMINWIDSNILDILGFL